MSGSSTRSMTFLATPPEAFSALQEAARRAGLRYLSGDVGTGTSVFTAGRSLMSFGEKVTARIQQAAPGTVEVTFSSDTKFGVVGWSGRGGAGADRLAGALEELLPRSG